VGSSALASVGRQAPLQACSHPSKGTTMNLTISGHHLDVSPALKDYTINVLLSSEKLREKERRKKAEVTLHVKGKEIFIEQCGEDLYAAIDQLIDKLDRQVCRHKGKVQDHHHAGLKRSEPVEL